jgi:lipid A 3-O-deacylase PagL
MRPKGCGLFSTVAAARLGGAGRSGLTRVGRFGAVLTGALCLTLSQPASAQNALPAANLLTAQADAIPALVDVLAAPLVTTTDQPPKPRPASEITVEGLVSYGNYHIFASGENCKLYDVGIEYDRHYWGHLFKARVDYVAEVMPMVLLNQPTLMDIWGNTLSQSRKSIPGVDISPIGIRWLWRDGKAIKPYLMAKGGALVFSQKPLSNKTTYENLSLQSAFGLEVRMNDRYDLRLGLFGDFHFSDGFIVPVNPGLDVMNATMGLTYHLGSKKKIAETKF